MKILREYKVISTRAIIKAERLVGSETELARIVGVNRQNINYWKSPHTCGLLPYDVAIRITMATRGEVTLYELRPDLKYLTDDWITFLEQFGVSKLKTILHGLCLKCDLEKN